MSYSSSVLLCCNGNHVFILKQRFGFLSVSNFQFPYPWKPCLIMSWFPRNSLSVATYLPICFLETAHMSKYFAKQNIIAPQLSHKPQKFSCWLILTYWLTRTGNYGSELHPSRMMFFVRLKEICHFVRKLLGRTNTHADTIYFPSLL
jgi:hypothetical protein